MFYEDICWYLAIVTLNSLKNVGEQVNLREHLLDLEAIIMEHNGKFECIFDLLSQLLADKNEPHRLIEFNKPEPPHYGKRKY